MNRLQLSERDLVRFWSKVALPNAAGCMLWLAGLNDQGYGQMGIGSRTDGSRAKVKAHRVSYYHAYGDVPEGLELDHLCRVRNCVAPEHLEAVTPLVNTRRSHGNSSKTRCPVGHEYTSENTYIDTNRGRSRRCRTCHLERVNNRAMVARISRQLAR